MDRKVLHDSNFQNELVKRAKKGNKQARDLLVESLSGFVITIAQKKAPSPTLVPDLVQEGYAALLGRAINSYNEKLGVPFRSYAVYWIIASIESYLNNNLVGFPFRVPYNIGFDFRHNSPSAAWLKQQRFLTKLKDIEGELTDIFECLPYTDEEYDKIFDEELRDNFDKDVKDILDKGNIDKDLLKRNADIFMRYFCIGKYKEYPNISLKNLGEFYGISQQRVANIIKYAVQKLRNPNNQKALKYMA